MDIKLNDGRKEYKINGNVIKVNPGDIGILTRLQEGEKRLEEVLKKHANTENTIKAVSETDKIVREMIDEMFDFPVSNAVFGRTSSLALIEGKLFVQMFLDAFLPVLNKDITKEQKAFEKNVSKYTSKMKGLPK